MAFKHFYSCVSDECNVLYQQPEYVKMEAVDFRGMKHLSTVRVCPENVVEQNFNALLLFVTAKITELDLQGFVIQKLAARI